MDDRSTPPTTPASLRRSSIGDAARALTPPAPAAFLAFWGVLIYVFRTQPIRPYTDGAWAGTDLFWFGLLGALISLVSRPLSAAAGTLLGMAAAVALQLFVLAGQSHYQAVVVAALTASTWMWATTGALAMSLGAMAVGFVVARGLLTVWRRIGHQPQAQTESPPDGTEPRPMSRTIIAGFVVLTIVGLVAGVSLFTTAQSAYLPSKDEPIVRVQLLDDGTLALEPGSVPAGRMTIIASGTRPLDYLTLFGPLSVEDQAGLMDGHIRADVGGVYWNHAVGRAEVIEPGQYAFVDLVPEWLPPEDEAGWTAWLEQGGFVPVTAVRLFQVDAAPAGVGPSTDAGGDGGTYLTLPAAVALGIAGWATAGSLFLAIRRYRRPTRTHVVVAVMTGLVSAAFVGILAGLAISQAHSPF